MNVLLNCWVIMIPSTRGLTTNTLTNNRAKVQCLQLRGLAYTSFPKGSSIMTFFAGSPISVWTRAFRLDYIELP